MYNLRSAIASKFVTGCYCATTGTSPGLVEVALPVAAASST